MKRSLTQFLFVDASTLTLYWAMTCLMISPSDVGLPSLPAADKSTAGMVKVSVTIFCFTAVGLMRVAADAPQAEVAGLFVGCVGASDGNASSDSVLGVPFWDDWRGAAGVGSFRLGNGSGAPSRLCRLYKIVN